MRSIPTPPWYSDSSLERDRSHVIPADRGFDYRRLGDTDDGSSIGIGLAPTMLDILKQQTTRIIPFRGNQVFVRQLEGEETDKQQVAPLCLLYHMMSVIPVGSASMEMGRVQQSRGLGGNLL